MGSCSMGLVSHGAMALAMVTVLVVYILYFDVSILLYFGVSLFLDVLMSLCPNCAMSRFPDFSISIIMSFSHSLSLSFSYSRILVLSHSLRRAVYAPARVTMSPFSCHQSTDRILIAAVHTCAVVVPGQRRCRRRGRRLGCV